MYESIYVLVFHVINIINILKSKLGPIVSARGTCDTWDKSAYQTVALNDKQQSHISLRVTLTNKA